MLTGGRREIIAGWRQLEPEITANSTSDSRAQEGGKESLRKNETVSVDPIGVLGVESHELVKKHMRDRGHAHRRTGVAGVSLSGSIDLEENVRRYTRHHSKVLGWVGLSGVAQQIMANDK